MGSLTDHKSAALPGNSSISDREIAFWASYASGPGTGAFTSTGIGNIPIISKGFAGQTADLQQWQDSTAAVLSRINFAGFHVIKKIAAPAAADLAANELVAWLDGTAAATKVMFMAKDTVGTVKTASIAMV